MKEKGDLEVRIVLGPRQAGKVRKGWSKAMVGKIGSGVEKIEGRR